ncbi:hypothetical protein A0H81_08412 [Grifola frondosa]|uniref:Alpha/beta hydrolase fold-3 domain-containing protein n=1 Tax=Grifola frondosa TaxID=5627 RepID=A0A1C7M2V8_GRIFR|nr:hypothetical protein A0H81_08412 [Grifola frondosa]
MTPAGDSSSADTLVEPLTFAYKRVQDTAIHLDLYPPCLPDNTNVLKPCEPALVPAVVYFHGGGLTVGNRRSWFPSWLHKRVVSAGIAFISADYRLLPPATGHDILADIKDVFRFLSEDINTMLQSQGDPTGLDKPPSKCPTFSIDAIRLQLQGAALVIISLYGMGGDFLTSHYLCPKTEVFFRGREMLDPTQFSEYLYPLSCDLAANPDSPLSYHPNTFHIPGYPSNPRMLLGRLYLQLASSSKPPSTPSIVLDTSDTRGMSRGINGHTALPTSHLGPPTGDEFTEAGLCRQARLAVTESNPGIGTRQPETWSSFSAVSTLFGLDIPQIPVKAAALV